MLFRVSSGRSGGIRVRVSITNCKEEPSSSTGVTVSSSSENRALARDPEGRSKTAKALRWTLYTSITDPFPLQKASKQRYPSFPSAYRLGPTIPVGSKMPQGRILPLRQKTRKQVISEVFCLSAGLKRQQNISSSSLQAIYFLKVMRRTKKITLHKYKFFGVFLFVVTEEVLDTIYNMKTFVCAFYIFGYISFIKLVFPEKNYRHVVFFQKNLKM